MRSVLSLMDVDLEAPDHTTLSRRSRALDIELHRVPVKGPIHLIVDSTGLSIVGEGEWAAAKHGGRGQRGWKKLHLGVDRLGVIVAHMLTEATVDDATTAIGLIEALAADIARVTADAAYDTIAFYATATARGATVVVPPSKTVRVSRRRPRSSARDRTIKKMKKIGRRRWKKEAGYPSASPGGERLLPVQIDHRGWSSRSLPRWASDRGGHRVQHPESDDRDWSAGVVPYWSVSSLWVGTAAGQFRLSSSPGGLLPRGPHQNRTRRFPPSGSSADVAHGDAPQIRTRIRGTGRGYRSNNATNLGQVRRVRLLRRRSHLYQCRSVASTSSPKLRALPLTPK